MEKPSSRQYVTRNISAQADQSISNRFVDKPQVGPGSPKQSWQRALYHIAALDFEYSSRTYQLWQCALKNAELRHEDDIRKPSQVEERLRQEQQEYEAALQQYRHGILEPYVVNRLCNVIYYAVQIYIHTGDISALRSTCEKASARAGIPVSVALECTAEKMWHRVNRGTSQLGADKEAENRLIQRILLEWQNS